MRLNDGLPVWHASVSVWSPDGKQMRDLSAIAEREGIKLVDGVGNDSEWWIWPGSLIGHLRVGVTVAEYESMDLSSCGPVVADAGPSGPLRTRSARR